jgi:hypothetical protein
MRNVIRPAVAAMAAVALAVPADAAFVLYDQNFENPTGFVNDGGDININRTVNQLYGGQPAGFTFAQANTVETLFLKGTQAFTTGYSDPSGIGGRYSLGMLSTFQNDLLSLSFNMQGQTFLNFRLTISMIDLDRFSGPFNGAAAVPVFAVRLYDNPAGTTGLQGNGTVLASTTITGVASPSRSLFNWTEHVVALNAAGSTNGNVTVQLDLLNTQGAGYAALDNFRIVASNTAGDLANAPAPATLAAFAVGLMGIGTFGRRKIG